MTRGLAFPLNSDWIARTFAATLLAACNPEGRLPVEAGYGPHPTLPAPRVQRIPKVNIAPAEPWPEGRRPHPEMGFGLTRFAHDLQHPRWLHVLPNGDVLVAETDTPPQPGKRRLMDRVQKHLQSRAGAGTPSANRITLLRDADQDGVAERRWVFAEGLNSPFGMALVGNWLYVANTDGIVRMRYESGATSVTSSPETVAALPAGDINHHWTKDLIASPDGQRLYATVGSNSDHGERGLDVEEGRAAIWEIELASGRQRVYASGLRNPNGLAWQPLTGELWVAVNERNALGDDLVPDYITSVREGGFYGWPYAYWGQNADPRVEPRRPDLVAKSLAPDYAVGSHTGSLGLAFTRDASAAAFGDGAFVGQHGSWNRRPRAGYRVIFIPFVRGRPAGGPRPVLSGFVDDEQRANGRPVGVAVDRAGGLLVADDVGNTVWRVTALGAQRADLRLRPRTELADRPRAGIALR